MSKEISSLKKHIAMKKPEAIAKMLFTRKQNKELKKIFTKISIIDFFDPYNVEHLKAYRVLEKTGSWPKGFLPKDGEGMEWPMVWQAGLTAKMAKAWLAQAEAGHIFGMPHFDQ
jgi:hypothetical protein